MNKTKLYTLPLLLLSQAALADGLLPQQENSAISFNQQLENSISCGGYLRAGYMHSALGSPKKLSVNAVGGELGCSLAVNPHVTAHLGAFTSVDTGLNHSHKNDMLGDFFDQDKGSYLILGEAYLDLSYANVELRLGRQRLDTPHMDSDDLRIVPNLFEAYMLEVELADNLRAGAGFVRNMSGWENGADQSHFEGVGDVLGGDGNKSWLAWASHEGEQLDSRVWYYNIPDHLQIIYADVTHGAQLTNDISYELGLQFDWGQDIGDHKLGDVDSKTWGLSAAFTYQQLTTTLAFNHNNSQQAALASLGGGPFYTSMEDQTLDAVDGQRAEALVLGMEYAACESMVFGFTAGQFTAKDKSDYDVQEIDLYMNYNWQENVALEVVYAQVDDTNTSGEDHQLRAILTYTY
ncbi:MAG: OprD family outer membrane porin [Cycloclasticus sp.]|jgi:outer membrane porin, OprD family.